MRLQLERSISPFILAACIAAAAHAQNYRIERIASGLSQPTYVTQAPDDPANILYFTERTSNTIAGFGAINDMGKVWRYDVATRAQELVLDLSDREVTNDTGLHNIAFHPDFNNTGTAGHGKMFVTLSERGATAVNKVEEYTIGPGGTASFDRTILQYDNNAQNNHTINWAGFDPTASGDERNYLYISTGDGAFGNDYNGGTSPTGRPSQNPNDIAGKMLRVDVSAGDDYPGDPFKNFAVPASNPIPVYNAANPGAPISGLGEVWLTGLRNAYRTSFDRATGDLWMGDVGEVAIESIDFLKAGSNTAGPPVDYGWPQWEGTQESPINGAPHTATNPFTGATSLDPIAQFARSAGGNAVIGGYLYRGPVPELEGKFFYSDFVRTGQIWALDFDRDTDPGDFDGNNGTVTDLTTLWQSLVVDPADPTYLPDSTTGSSAGLDHIVSFGEDNAGNLYIVDFGNGSGFNGQYPGAGLGEIFRVTPLLPTLDLVLTVSRETGEMVLANETGEAVDILSYSLDSPIGAIQPLQTISITGHYDAGPPGDGSLDDNDAWQITSPPGSQTIFAEQTTGDAGTLPVASTYPFGLEGAWVQSIYEDLEFSITLGDGSMVVGSVEFLGNGGQPFDRSDLNFNGAIDPADWPLFRAAHLTDLSGLTPAESYQQGDLDGDGDNDFDDFRLFQVDYTAANGAQAFAALLNGNIPEPGTAALALGPAAIAILLSRRRRERRLSAGHPTSGSVERAICGLLGIAAAIACVLTPSTTRADLRHQYTFNDGTANDSAGAAHGTLNGDPSFNLGVIDLPGGDEDYVELPAATINIDSFTDATFEAWFTWDGGGAWQRVFDFGDTFFGQGRDYIFYTPNAGGGVNRAAISDGGGGPDEDVANAGPTLSTGEPYHVAVVVDDAANGGSGNMDVYLNGALAGSTELSVSLSDLSDDMAFLGESMYPGDANLNGQIDEFRLYDHALTAQQVMESFAIGPVPLELFRLEVNSVTGSVVLLNGPTNVAFDYYRIASPGGALDTAGWSSLDDQNIDATGAGEGESWDEMDQNDAFEIAELFLLGASNLTAGEALELGHLFEPSVFGQGEGGDLVFQFGVQGGGLVSGDVIYVTPDLAAGDYNDNGIVDAADYTIWRDSFGSTSDLRADGDGDQLIDDDDYAVWKWTFGNLANAGAATALSAVPEPASVWLLVAGCLGSLRPMAWRRDVRRN
jgi:glucose/arabinose dehydrogenase